LGYGYVYTGMFIPLITSMVGHPAHN